MTDRDHKDTKPIQMPPPASRDQTVPPAITSYSVPPADMLTEQEKDTGAETPGVGPATPAATTTGPAETMEDLGIGPREPYPSGNPPPPINETDAPTARKTPRK